jgi:hypothetical protein
LFNKTHTLYEIGVKRLVLQLSNGTDLAFDQALANGRANYVIFEELIRNFTGLLQTTGSDHKDSGGKKFEQKSYPDAELYPNSPDLFRISSSSTFGANNHGPKVKAFLENDDYESALELCKTTGYNKNDFYIFTNTGGFKPESTLRYIILPKDEVLEHLDSEDPRMISRYTVLGLAKSKVVIG